MATLSQPWWSAVVTAVSAEVKKVMPCHAALSQAARVSYIEGVNLLCMESTFNNAFASVATEKLHCTTSMAATLAKKAHVGELLLTHISARFKEPELLLAEAQAVFPNTAMAADGAQHEVRYFDKIPAAGQGVSDGA